MTIISDVGRIVPTTRRPFDRLDGIVRPGCAGTIDVIASLRDRRPARNVPPAAAPSVARRQACLGNGPIILDRARDRSFPIGMAMRGGHADAGISTRIGTSKRHHRAVVPSSHEAAEASAASVGPDVRPGPVSMGSATQHAGRSLIGSPCLRRGPRPRTGRTGSSPKPIASPTITDATRQRLKRRVTTMDDDHERGMPDPGLLRLATALGRYQAIRDREPDGDDREHRGRPGRDVRNSDGRNGKLAARRPIDDP